MKELSLEEAALAWAQGKRVEAEALGATERVWGLIHPIGTTSGYWNPNVFGGLACSCRFRLAPEPPAPKRSAMANGYPLQCAFYDDGWRLLGDDRFKGFKFVAYEKPSRLVNVHRCTPELMAWGREKYMAALATYIRCVNSGEWPGYVGEVEFDLPAWAGRDE